MILIVLGVGWGAENVSREYLNVRMKGGWAASARPYRNFTGGGDLRVLFDFTGEDNIVTDHPFVNQATFWFFNPKFIDAEVVTLTLRVPLAEGDRWVGRSMARLQVRFREKTVYREDCMVEFRLVLAASDGSLGPKVAGLQADLAS